MWRPLFAMTALALLAPLFTAAPARAATGYHAAYFSESAFLALARGQTGQLAVGYTNTGDQAWAVVSARASLHTAAPLDNTADFDAGWSVGWPGANVYALQASDAVSPGQVGYFIYTVKVPAAAAAGNHTFYGRPAVAGAGFLEDYGYYQVVNVVDDLVGSPALVAATSIDLRTVLAQFDRPMSCATDGSPGSIATGASYAFDVSETGVPVAQTVVATPSASCDRATLALSGALSEGVTYRLTASNVRDAAGTTIGARVASFTAVARPVVTAVTWSSAAQLIVSFSKPMRWPSGAGSPSDPTSYEVNGQGRGALCRSGAPPTVTTDQQVRTFAYTCSGSLGTWGPSGTNTLTIRDVTDSTGTAIWPNPTIRAF